MKAITFAAVATYANAGAAITASRACVTNMGGYDLYWWFTDLIDGKESNHSPTYPID